MTCRTVCMIPVTWLPLASVTPTAQDVHSTTLHEKDTPIANVTCGAALGESVGDADGAALGESVDDADGAALGEPVGNAVGAGVGDADGIMVGDAVGADVGNGVGASVGDADGIMVGDAVGGGGQHPLLQHPPLLSMLQV